MTKRSVIYTVGGDPKTRMSNVIAGDRTGGRAKFNSTSGMFAVSPYAKRPAPLSSYIKSKDQPRIRPATADIDIRGYFGDERTGIRKNVGPLTKPPAVKVTAAKAKPTAAKPAKAKPPAVVRTTTNMKTTPVTAAAPARMAVNRVTGNTTGFTTGTRTGTTSTKSGVAGRTSTSSFGRSEAARASRGVGGK